MAQSTMKQWQVESSQGADSLHSKEIAIPRPGEYEILVKFHAASLNYRDILIINGKYMWKTNDGIVPGSDAAGEVVELGPKVTRFAVGHRISPIFHLTHLAGSLKPEDLSYKLGSTHNGVFPEFGVFNEQACVEIPSNLSYREAAALPCAAVTAWNALYGGSRKLMPGDIVLTQGTGGVSIFALQFAKMGGAQVISTTSSAEKAARLKTEGADHVINYKEDPRWGETAKRVSNRCRGADFVIEIGGANTMEQSIQAVAIDGEIAVIGSRAGANPDGSSGGHHTTSIAAIRRIVVGSRRLSEAMNAAFEVNNLHPIIEPRVWKFSDLPRAFEDFATGDHFGKVLVDFH